MKNKKWRIVALIGVILLFAVRMYNAKRQEDNREQQKQLMYELSEQQMRERQKADTLLKINTDQIFEGLDEQKRKLDSMRVKLEENQLKFQEQMKDLEKKK